MKVSLFFPPHWTPTMPHLALPALTAYLRMRGIDVTQRDLNVEAFDALLSRASLQGALRTARRRHRTLTRRRRSDPLVQAEFEHLENLLPGADDLVEDIELAKRILRGPEFYEPDENLGAMLTVIDGLELVSARYFPTNLSWYGYQTLQSPDSTQGTLAAIGDMKRNMFIDFYRRAVISGLARDMPDLVGISISTVHQVVPGLTLAAMIKSFAPDLHITVGGKMITCWRDELPHNRDLFALFDSAIIYDGESALAELAECLADGSSLAGVPNLIHREGDRIRVNEARESEDVNALPPPDFCGLPLDKYLAPEIILPIEACRGCYWRRCAFCNLGYGQSRTFRPRRPGRVVEEMALLQERYGARSFFFVDEALSSHMLGALVEDMAQRNLDVRWAACTRFEKSLSADLLKRSANSGGKMLMYGLESGDQFMLDRIDKGTDVATMSRVLHESAEAGIWNHVFVFFGFPGETKQNAEATLRFVQDHLEAIHSIAGGTFILEKYSQVYENPEQYGVARIVHDPKADLAFQYAYEVVSGQTATDARASLGRFSEEIEAHRVPKALFYDVYNLLYATHFEDPSALLTVTP